MAKDAQIKEIHARLDDLAAAVEAYREYLAREQESARQEQPTNGVYIRRIGTGIGYLDEMLAHLEGEVRDLLIRTADISFTKNQARDPDFV